MYFCTSRKQARYLSHWTRINVWSKERDYKTQKGTCSFLEKKSFPIERKIAFIKVSVHKVKGRLSLLTSQVAHQAEAYPGFSTMKRLGVFLLPLDGMLLHCRVTPSVKFTGSHLYTWVKRGTTRVMCLAQEHNTMSPGWAQNPVNDKLASLCFA